KPGLMRGTKLRCRLELPTGKENNFTAEVFERRNAEKSSVTSAVKKSQVARNVKRTSPNEINSIRPPQLPVTSWKKSRPRRPFIIDDRVALERDSCSDKNDCSFDAGTGGDR